MKLKKKVNYLSHSTVFKYYFVKRKKKRKKKKKKKNCHWKISLNQAGYAFFRRKIPLNKKIIKFKKLSKLRIK
jgi:hypothetical protein